MRFFNIVVLSTWILITIGCNRSIYRNFSEAKQPTDVGIVRERGYRFWVDGSGEKPADEMWLNPGEYMIRFRSITGESGAAICRLEKGRIYRIKIVDRTYLPKSGGYIFEGRCNPEGE